MNDPEVQAAIREALRFRLWTRTDLARHLRSDLGWPVNEAMIRKWERGTHIPLDRNREKLMAGLERYKSVGQLELLG